MYSSPMRMSRVWHVAVALTVVGVVGGIALILSESAGAERPGWIRPVVGGGALAGAAAFFLVMVRIVLKIESNTARSYNEIRDVCETLGKSERALATISENTAISDAAKSIVHRSHERQTLRTAIMAEVGNGDYEAVLHLIDELETRLGYSEEAERLRVETREAAADAFRSKLKEVLQHVNKLLDAHDWTQAEREIKRLEKLMPGEKRIGELWELLDEKRQLYKQSLLRDWNEATRSSDIERGIALLKELDPYLAREEARALEDGARGLLKERLLQLGVQFQFAVKERRWRDALSTGLQIAEEYPNSRMAQEVRERMEPLRTRAGLAGDVEVIARAKQDVAEAPKNPQ